MKENQVTSLQPDTKGWGVTYRVSESEVWLERLRNSIVSLRHTNNPNLPITVFYFYTTNHNLIDHFLKGIQKGIVIRKVETSEYSPNLDRKHRFEAFATPEYDVTLRLDCDTLILGDVTKFFKSAEESGFGVVLDHWQPWCRHERTDRKIRQYNGGVVSYSKPASAEFSSRLSHYKYEHVESDQQIFNSVLDDMDYCEDAALPIFYNRPGIKGETIVYHFYSYARQDEQLAMQYKEILAQMVSSTFHAPVPDLSLQSIGHQQGTDKATAHLYLDVYEALFRHYRNKNARLLEIGCLDGASLRMWRDWLPKANVFGLDIAHTPCVPGVETLQGNSTDQSIPLDRFPDEQFDIIIDDGSHDPAVQLATYKLWSQWLAEDGMYIIEDIRSSSDIEQFRSLSPVVIDRSKVSGRTDDILLVLGRKTPLAETPQKFTQSGDSIFSVLVCCYGDYPQYSKRCLESIVSLSSNDSRFPIHVACNSCCDETVEYLHGLYRNEQITSLHLSHVNRNKDPMMRQLIASTESEYFIWLDDDSHFVRQDWDRKFERFILDAPDLDLGGHIFFCHRSDDYQEFLRKRPWYANIPEEDGRVFFATGGLWIARTEFLRENDFPDRKMVKKLDDLLLGDLCYQQKANLVDFSHDPGIMDSIKINDGTRRGEGEGDDGWIRG